MGKIRDDAFGYSYTVVAVFGILGNILVILSILRQKMNLLKNDYYFLVLHLSICDLASLIIYIFNIVDDFWLDKPFSDHCPMITCHVNVCHAICDPAALVIYSIVDFWLKEQLSDHSPMVTCHVNVISEAFQFAGIGMMLIISLLRYRATVHPLKPSVSRRKLKVVCGLVYLVGLILACGTYLPLCSIKSKVVVNAYKKFYDAIL